ncbi:hypothetical protein SAMN05216223_12981 [Actinacidiphila yanglinensis]|uniref:Uncharacterized protein n=1 Tax=Actinacidiphila yanglinensis TaxID=310779 RepID=A0A1H6EAT7_9ACTN|nr:hypothetical protein [Actinacidiphila yanglinensis]SEG94219.1 hypothetical protein SAMN05216223_12981 [Actinacidiphila yanglinensis]
MKPSSPIDVELLGSAVLSGEDLPFGSADAFQFDPMHSDAGEAAPEWTRKIPVSVNDTYGDPFIPEQIDNTVAKLTSLATHRAPIAIFTKAGYDDAVLEKLHGVAHVDKVVVFYSLTGLDEGGISFDDRVRFIAAIKRIFPNTLVFTRPIIRNRNDDPAMLRRLSEVAAEHTGLLVLGGLHDSKKRKKIELPIESQLIEFCDELGVKTFHKTSCAGAWLHGLDCWVHGLGAPRNLDVLVALGYQFGIANNSVVLERGTTGDINFVRMLTRSNVYVHELVSNYNLLTLPSGHRKLESTSSWFAWSENIPTCLDCNYCIIKQIEYLKKMQVRIGVHPTRLPEIVVGTDSAIDFDRFRLTKLPDVEQGRHTYADVRVAKPCRVPLYPSPVPDALRTEA